MEKGIVNCPKCHRPLPPEWPNRPDPAPCPGCGVRVLAAVFPALWRPLQARAAEAPAPDEHSSCFYHPASRAERICEHCGRFLCRLCDVEFKGQHLCPNCIASGVRTQRLKGMENQRFLYDELALGLALLPLLMWPFTLITAPAALFVALWFWKRPSSIIPRTKARLILAVFFAAAQIAGWTVLFYVLINRR